ncbi:MAG: hypothetical protein HY219_01190 [Candidatus Staskawiczbacteria bacterium]|nr:hypothetical protein [Candidatus Staskawiczbacteria bacterium]
MNKFFSKLILIIKTIISAFLIYLVFSSYNFNDPLLPGNNYQMKLGSTFLTLFLITLPTLFVFWLKDRVILHYPKFSEIWKVLRVIYAITLIILLLLVINSFYRFKDYNKTQQAIDFINSKKIILFDVMGQNLPPKPDQNLNDSTIEGIDANNNFIRDDVELAIFEKYPNSAKIRAAELQYAQALQLELTQVFNSETLVATLQKESRGRSCVDRTGPEINLKDSHKKILVDLAVGDDRKKEIINLIINTDMRKKKESDVLDKYMTTYSILPSQQECDIDILSLPN